MILREYGFLTVADARRCGLLEPFQGRRKICIGFTLIVEQPKPQTLRFYTPFDDYSDDFAVSDDRFWHSTDIRFSTVRLKFGDRFYFTCPKLGTRCFKLMFYKEIVCSKRAFPLALAASNYARISANHVEARALLLKMSAAKRWSAPRRAQILEQAAHLEGLDETVDRALAREQIKADKYRHRWLWESREASTTKALDCGRSLFDTKPFLKMLARDDDWFFEPDPAVKFAASTSADCLTAYGELDIRVLIERNELSFGQLTGRSLGWPSALTDGHFISMFVRPRDDELPQIVMQIEASDGSTHFQTIELLSRRDSAKPRYFLCPMERARTDVLYFRNGFFASRSAHFLRYPPGGKIGVIEKIQAKIPKLSPATWLDRAHRGLAKG